LPKQTIDGHDIRPLLFGTAGARSPADERGFFYYHMHQLQAVRSGPWKLYLPLEKKRADLVNKRAATPLRLFNVRDDIGETQEVSTGNPEVVARLMKLAQAARAELGDEDAAGSGQRSAGLAHAPTARQLE
jgi:arylsulfatase A-like enzyme